MTALTNTTYSIKTGSNTLEITPVVTENYKETCSINQCSVYSEGLHNKSIGCLFFNPNEITITKISVIFAKYNLSSTDLLFAIYQGIYFNVNGVVPLMASNGNRTMTLKGSGILSTIHGDACYATVTLNTPIKVKGWFSILLGGDNITTPAIYASINYADAISTDDSVYPMQFIRDDIYPGMGAQWPTTFNPETKNNQHHVDTKVTPYIKITHNDT